MTPLIRIERGEPTDDELAAAIAALLTWAHSIAGPRVTAARPGRWVASARPRSGRLARPGPNAWRRSALP